MPLDAQCRGNKALTCLLCIQQITRMFDEYFNDWEVRQGFEKEFISLWPHWLGMDNLHLLDEICEDQWSRFNALMKSISSRYVIGVADCTSHSIAFPERIEEYLADYDRSMQKGASQFSKFVIPDLHCVITEEWDYTYILWHNGRGEVAKLAPFIHGSQLHHFAS